METGNTRAISEAKQERRLMEWSEQIERQQSSGLSVEQWCDENGIKPKTEDVLLPLEKGAGTMCCGTAFHRTDSNAG